MIPRNKNSLRADLIKLSGHLEAVQSKGNWRFATDLTLECVERGSLLDQI